MASSTSTHGQELLPNLNGDQGLVYWLEDKDHQRSPLPSPKLFHDLRGLTKNNNNNSQQQKQIDIIQLESSSQSPSPSPTASTITPTTKATLLHDPVPFTTVISEVSVPQQAPTNNTISNHNKSTFQYDINPIPHGGAPSNNSFAGMTKPSPSDDAIPSSSSYNNNIDNRQTDSATNNNNNNSKLESISLVSDAFASPPPGFSPMISSSASDGTANITTNSTNNNINNNHLPSLPPMAMGNSPIPSQYLNADPSHVQQQNWYSPGVSSSVPIESPMTGNIDQGNIDINNINPTNNNTNNNTQNTINMNNMNNNRPNIPITLPPGLSSLESLLLNESIPREFSTRQTFVIIAQPCPNQRKCYSKENRYLNPNPIILSQLDANGQPVYDHQTANATKLAATAQGWVTVSLVDHENNVVPHGIECPHLGFTRVLENGVICWSIKALQNSGPGRKFRLKFTIVYAIDRHQQKVLVEEHVYTDEFGVFSNKNNRINKITGLGVDSPKRSKKTGKQAVSRSSSFGSPMLSESDSRSDGDEQSSPSVISYSPRTYRDYPISQRYSPYETSPSSTQYHQHQHQHQHHQHQHQPQHPNQYQYHQYSQHYQYHEPHQHQQPYQQQQHPHPHPHPHPTEIDPKSSPSSHQLSFISQTMSLLEQWEQEQLQRRNRGHSYPLDYNTQEQQQRIQRLLHPVQVHPLQSPSGFPQQQQHVGQVQAVSNNSNNHNNNNNNITNPNHINSNNNRFYQQSQ